MNKLLNKLIKCLISYDTYDIVLFIGDGTNVIIIAFLQGHSRTLHSLTKAFLNILTAICPSANVLLHSSDVTSKHSVKHTYLGSLDRIPASILDTI